MEGARTDLLRELSGWTLEAQLEAIAEAIWSYQVLGGADECRYEATDREINLLGLIAASHELPPGEASVYTFPSGAAVRLAEPGEPVERHRVVGQVQISDLPRWISDWCKRMRPELQPERERELPALNAAVVEQKKRYNQGPKQIRVGRTRKKGAENERLESADHP